MGPSRFTDTAMMRPLACLLITALLLAACGPSQPEGAQLAVTIVGDPGRATGLSRRMVAEASQPTLVARDGNGQTIAGLATSWRFVDDGRSLILRLRPTKWSDGKPLVAADVVASFRRAAQRREPALAATGIAGAPAIITGQAPAARLGVLAPISRVVEIRLDAASPLLLGWLAEPGLGIMRDKASLAAYVASGPPERRVLKRAAMAATPDARPAAVIVSTTSDIAPAIAAFVAGKQDIVIGEGLAGLGAARTVRSDALRIDPMWGVYGYLVNALKGPTADAGVRRALAMAIDRAALADSFGIGAMQPAESLLAGMPGLPVARPDWATLLDDARLAEARHLLAAAGWNPDHPLRLVLLLPPGHDHRAVAERIGADWARAGVLLAVTEVEADAYDRLVARGDFDLAVSEPNMAVPDPAAQLARFHCGDGPFCDPAADAVLAAAEAAPPAARPALLADADTLLMAAPPLIPLFTSVRWALVSRRVDGWLPNRGGNHPLARLAVERN